MLIMEHITIVPQLETFLEGLNIPTRVQSPLLWHGPLYSRGRNCIHGRPWLWSLDVADIVNVLHCVADGFVVDAAVKPGV